MKQQTKLHLNPTIVKIVAVLTIFLSSFYYQDQVAYSLVLKKFAFFILISSLCIKAIKNGIQKQKNDALLFILIESTMYLTDRLEEAIVLLLVRQVLECIYLNLSKDSVEVISIKRKNKMEKIPISKIKKNMILILNKGDIIPVDGCYIKKVSTKGVEKILSGTIICENHTEIKALENYKKSKWFQLEEQKQRIYEELQEQKNLYEKYKRRVLITIGIFLIFIPNFITQKFEIYLIYLGTVVLYFATQETFQESLYNLKINFVNQLFLHNIIPVNFEKVKKLKHIKTIIFEKTGTLTLGKFRVTGLKTKNEKQFLEYLNYVEYYSNHLIAKTIQNYKKVKIEPKRIKDFKEVAARGVECRVGKQHIVAGNIYFLKEKGISIKKEQAIGTVIYLAVDNVYLGNIVLSDSIKYSIQEMTEELKNYGVKNFSVLSGDNERINKAVCQVLKINDQYSNLTPMEKKFWFQHLKEQMLENGYTMFVGNESTDPELMDISDISVCLSQEIESTQKSNFLIIYNQLETLPNLFQISKDFRKKKHQISSIFIGLRIVWILLALMETLPLWVIAIVEEIGLLIIRIQINRKW